MIAQIEKNRIIKAMQQHQQQESERNDIFRLPGIDDNGKPDFYNLKLNNNDRNIN